MENLRNNMPKEINGSKVLKVDDYANSVGYNLKINAKTQITLPKSDVLAYYLEDGCSLIVRPSGTEPKIKFYLSAVGEDRSKPNRKIEELTDYCNSFLIDEA